MEEVIALIAQLSFPQLHPGPSLEPGSAAIQPILLMRKLKLERGLCLSRLQVWGSDISCWEVSLNPHACSACCLSAREPGPGAPQRPAALGKGAHSRVRAFGPGPRPTQRLQGLAQSRAAEAEG